MTYFADLTPYRYGFGPIAWPENGPPSLEPTELYGWMWNPDDGAFDLPELTVGWLDSSHEWRRGKLPTQLVNKLEQLCRVSRYHVTRGFHPCGICGNVTDGLGSKEIRILGDGVVYAAPNKIVHYVAEHDYAPPDGFVAALDRCLGLAEARRGFTRPITMDMISRENIDVMRLEAEVRALLQTEHREGTFQRLSIEDGGNFVHVVARIDLRPRFEPIERTWEVPKQTLLNMVQAVNGMVAMLEAVYTEASLAWYVQSKIHRRG